MAIITDVNPGGLNLQEREFLLGLGLDDELMDGYECFLDFGDFLLARDLVEISSGRSLSLTDDGPAYRALLELIKAVNRGSTCIDISPEEKEALIQGYPSLFGEAGASCGSPACPVLFFPAEKGFCLCFEKHFSASAAFSRDGLTDGGSALDDAQKRELEDLLPKVRTETGKEYYSVEQKDAVFGIPKKGLYIITGGPGTGKTTVVAGIIFAFARILGTEIKDMVLCAPTGKAAARLGESVEKELARIGYDAPAPKSRTIHSLLSPYLSGRRKAGRLPYRLIVADEFSMADIMVAKTLFENVSDDACLVLVGDPDQLPSVEAGTVLRSLIGAYTGRVKQLTVNQRSQENIKALAAALKETNAGEALMRLMEEGKSLRTVSDIEELFDGWSKNDHEADGFVRILNLEPGADLIDKWFGFAYSEKYKTLVENASSRIDPVKPDPKLCAPLFAEADRFRLLCCTRKGFMGCDSLNDMLEKKLKLKHNLTDGSGVPIIITQNSGEFHNGDTGIILVVKDDSGTEHKALFRKGDGYVVRPLSALPPWEKAFAITVHKSQGSEYDNVLLLVPTVGEGGGYASSRIRELLTREILYTGVTRAKKALCIAAAAPETLKTIADNPIRRRGIPISVK